MLQTPIAADDTFTFAQGGNVSVVTGNLGADNGAGVDFDPDGTLLGWVAGTGFNPVGDGDRYLGAYFSGGVLGFLTIQGTVSYPFPVFSTSTSITTAGGGVVTLNTSGGFSYTSALGYTGTDSFTYTLVDADFQTTTATVTLNVTPTAGANDRPVAADDIFAGFEDTVISGSLLANNGTGPDSDPDGDLLGSQPQTIVSGAGGIVWIFADGTFTYTPKAGFSGNDWFDYTLRDPSGATDIGRASLAIAAVNDAPVAVDDSFTLVHDRSVSGNVLVNNGLGPDRDADGDALAVVAGSFSTASGGQVNLQADGSFVYQSAAGYVGPDYFDYTLADPSGATDIGRVNLILTNTAPVAVLDRFDLGVGSTATGNLLLSNGYGADSDPDGDALSVTAQNITSASGSVLQISATGQFSFRPGELFFGTETFAYRLRDSLGATATGTVQFAVALPVGAYLGTSYDDIWTGSDSADTGLLGAGDDTASGLGGNDLIGGGAGDDVLTGGLGNDRLYGQADKDSLVGSAGADWLYGGAGADILSGGGGADRLLGGSGNDKLSGGAGADQFIFDAPALGTIDRITDFTAIDRLVFAASDLGLAAGALSDLSFLVARGAAAIDHGRFVYDAAVKGLFWDADGTAATADVQVARFDTNVTLTLDHFLLV